MVWGISQFNPWGTWMIPHRKKSMYHSIVGIKNKSHTVTSNGIKPSIQNKKGCFIIKFTLKWYTLLLY